MFFEKNKDYRDLVQVYFQFGIAYKQMGKYDKSIDYLKRRISLISDEMHPYLLNQYSNVIS